MSLSCEAGLVRLVSIKLKPGESAHRVKKRVLKSIRSSERKEHKAEPISHPLEPWRDALHTLPDVPTKDVLKVVTNCRYVVFLLRDGRVCRLPVQSSGVKTRDSTRVDQNQEPSFQVLSDAEYARQLQAEFNTAGRGRGRERREGGGGGGAGALSDNLARGASILVSAVPSHSLGERGEGEEEILGIRPATRFSAATDTVSYMDWEHLHTPVLPVVDSNVQSTNQDARLQSSLAMGQAQHARSPPPGYTTLFSRSTSSMERGGGGAGQGRGEGGEGGRAESSNTRQPAPRYHGNRVGTGEGVEPGDKGIGDRKTHPWPAMGVLEWAQSGETTDLLFSDVGALHSEIVLITQQSRQLYSWSCHDANSPPRPHPLNKELGLATEALLLLQASECRATVTTESGKLATFYDSSLRDCPHSSSPSLIQSLSHPATEFPDLHGERVVRLAVSNFLSVATTQSGRVFWWGLTPQAKRDPTSPSSSSPSRERRGSRGLGGRGQISDGSLVRLKNGPPCGPNAVVLSISPTHGPQVGKTVSIMERSSIDPKTSVLVKVFRDLGRSSTTTGRTSFEAARLDLYEPGDVFSRLEVWKLSEVVFLDDSPSVLGRVVAIDQQQVVVDCGFSQTHADLVQGESTAKSSLKVFKLSELEACIEGPDFQPKSKPTSSAAAFPPSSSSSILSEDSTVSRHSVSRHVAGTVQHRPVCLLDPSPSKPHQLKSFDASLSESPQVSSRLCGFSPLAVQATDAGPNLLMEHVANGNTHLVCSAHLNTTALNATSFVALGYRDTKAKRCTVSEESVNAIEGGLKINWPLVQAVTAMPTSLADITTEATTKSSKTRAKDADQKRKASTRKGKSLALSKTAQDSVKGSAKSSLFPSPSSTAVGLGTSDTCAHSIPPPFLRSDFIAIKAGQPDLFFIRDTSGCIWPLVDGLSLRWTAGGSGNHGNKRLSLPLQSYRCVQSRQYTTQADGEVAVFVLVPHTQTLIPALQNGSSDIVCTALAKLSTQLELSLSSSSKVDEKNIPESLGSADGGFGSKPVLQTSKAGQAEELEGMMETAEYEEGRGNREIAAQTGLKPASKTGQTGVETAELAREEGGGGMELGPKLRRRKSVPKSESRGRKRRRGRSGDGREADCEAPGEPKRRCPRVGMETDTRDDRETERSEGGVQVLSGQGEGEGQGPPSVKKAKVSGEAGEKEKGVESDVCEKGVESDVRVLMETTVNNCNILHVCCGGEEGFMTTFDPAIDGSSAVGIGQRRLIVLDHILSCKPVRPVITKLLCCRNVRGHTPFLHALHCQNYAAALRLLQCVLESDAGSLGASREERGGEEEYGEGGDTSSAQATAHPSQNRFSNLLNEAILAPGENEMTPLHSLLASFCETYDVKTMRLFISKLPQTYTAQQLLKLFQKRYPSAYKAEIFKQESGVEGEEGAGSGSSAEDSMEEEGGERGRSRWWLGGRGRTQALPERSRQRSLFNNTAPVVTSQSGVVYFSELSQLRAALKEMHNYRVVTSSSRSTGFGGHMTSVSFLHVHLEGSEDGEDEEQESNATTNLFSQIPDLSEFLSGHRRAGKRKEKKRPPLDSRLSSPVLAHQLFTKLLAHTQVCTAVSSAGDTVLVTLVHNPKCLSALEDALKLEEPTHPSTTPGALPFSLLNLSDIILARDSRRSTLTQHGTGTSSSQSGDAYYTSNPSVLNVPLLSVSRSFRNENHFPVQITMKVTSNKRRECSGGTTDSKPVTETSSEVATRPALKIHVSDKPIVVEGGKEAIEEGTREEEEEGERRASSPEYSMGSDCSLSSTSSLSEKPGSPASASRPPVTATTQPSTHSGRPRDGEENATLDDAKGTTTSDTQQGAALLSGSGGGGGGGDSSARPGGLKLAQYTLENLPENQSSTSSYMSDLLNAMCGGSGLGGVLGLLGTQTAVPSASGARGRPTPSNPTPVQSVPSLSSSRGTQPGGTGGGGGGSRGGGSRAEPSRPLSPISSALAELRKLQRQLDGTREILRVAEQKWERVAAAPAHLREVANVVAGGTEGARPEVLQMMSEAGILPSTTSTMPLGSQHADSSNKSTPAVPETDKQPSAHTSRQPSAAIVATTQPSDSVGSGSHANATGMESGQNINSGSSKPLSTPEPGTSSAEHALSGTCDFLGPLFTNWPCIVTTVLGFYPLAQSSDSVSTQQPGGQGIGISGNPVQSGLSQATTLSSVHALDSFTTHLILNCSDSCIKNFTTTIVEKINSCLAASNASNQLPVDLIDLNIQDIDLKSIDESVLPILVGKRFLNSVVRVLGMEHSRVKNTFVEMQQLRARGGGGEGGAAGGAGGEAARRGGREGRGDGRQAKASLKNVVKIAKSILTQFSWLSVQALAESADMAGAPVRLGVCKPMGANSVSAEYSMTSHRPSATSSYRGTTRQPEDPLRSLQRQLHIRSAHLVTNYTSHTAHGHHLPTEGIVLRPVVKSDGPNQDGSANIESVCVEGEGGTLHDSSFEDVDGSEREDETGDDPQSSQHTFSIPPMPMEFLRPPRADSEPRWHGMWSSSSSEDEHYMNFDPFADLDDEPRINQRNAAGRGEQVLPDNIYPFAWALDGRRIGETTTTTARSDSPTSFLFGGHHEPALPLYTIPSIRFGAGFLARTFSRFVKDLVDIVVTICDDKCTETSVSLPPHLESHLLRRSLSQLESTWQWVISVLDVAEGQLQRGQHFDAQRHVMSLRSDGPPATTTSHHVVHASRSFIGSTPAEYVTYLLRTHAKEDADCLPVIDLYGYEHVVYVLDALIYTLTHWPKSASISIDQSSSSYSVTTSSSKKPLKAPTNQSKPDSLQMECTPTLQSETETETQHNVGQTDRRFFHRSESILTGGSASESEGDPEIKKSNQKFFGPPRALLESPDLVGPTNLFGGGNEGESSFSRPLSETYPLAQQPHLLKPYAKKEHLFSSPARVHGMGEGGGRGGGGVGGAGGGAGDGEGRERVRGSSLPVSYTTKKGVLPIPPPVTLSLSVDYALQRWHSCISVFAHVFLAEGPGGERDNFLNARAGFASRMARFRQQVSQLYEASLSNREWSSTVSNSLSLRIRRDVLLQDSLEHLQQLTKFHYTQVRVKFEGEEGSGPGVNRGFFSTLSNELKSSDVSKPVLNQVGLLLSEPGKQPEQNGLFAPCPFVPRSGNSPTKTAAVRAQRKTYFRAIGRFLGLCFWFRYTIPLMVCRHVAKYLLGRDLAWHDLAFYNADLYEGLRRMLLDAQEGKKSKEEFMSTYCCYFEAPLSGTLEPDLIPGGSKVPVTPDRVQEYVRLYATFMMYGCVREELQAMKEGLNDVIPPELLAGLTAEDFQLLLSGGSANITLSRLKSVIRFNHTHGNTHTICDRFEKMFWRVVSHMSNTQRQELLYFATGSGALPTDSDTSARTPALQITIDVIGTGNTNSLPVASTCSQRMSIPLYPSYVVLKRKLLQAIQCQAYGLG